MSNILGIIAEYNPFHNGHLYHLNEAKNITKADYTIAVMSGNFTQRGNVSVINKWKKAQMAISAGVDLVIELPTIYSISSAENFAMGAIKLLNSLGVVKNIAFGAETCDLEMLNKIATILYEKPKEYVSILNHELSTGISYPKARENALLMYLNDIRKYANVLSSSNNILAIEYLKALKTLNSPITPISIKREFVGHDSMTINNNFASGSAIRNMLINNDVYSTRKLVPQASFEILFDCVKNGQYVPDLYKYEKEIIYTLRRMNISEIANLSDVTEGLENSIKEAANSCNSISEFINIIKSKRYTQTRFQRILLYSLLGITKKDMTEATKTIPYIRILGMNENGKELLSCISKLHLKSPVITSVKKFIDSNPNRILRNMLNIDIFATNVYTLGYQYDSWANLDYTQKLISL